MSNDELIELLAMLIVYKKTYKGSATKVEEVRTAEEMIDYLLKQLAEYNR